MRFPTPPPCVAMAILLGGLGIFAPPSASGLLLAACGLALGGLYTQNQALRTARTPAAPAPPRRTERRQAPRVQPSRDVIRATVLLDGVWVSAGVIDISTSGTRLRLPCGTAPPEAVALSLHLDGRCLPALGRLRWQARDGDHLLVGLAFDGPQRGGLAEAIGAWVRANAARPVQPRPVRLAG